MARQSPCGWVPDAPCLTAPGGPCCPDIPANPAIAALSLEVAASLIWALTGRQFGLCEYTVRPCKISECDTSLYESIYMWDRLGGSDNLGVGIGGTFPLLMDGQTYNVSCGCKVGCCTCKGTCEFYLPGPVESIVNITVGGVVRAPSTYQLYSDGRVVFLADPVTGEINCPPCQNYDHAPGEDDTWSVTYLKGQPVPDVLNLAAGLYACEWAKSLLGQPCGLPSYAIRIQKPGVDIEYPDPFELVKEGLTGVILVDQLIKAYNPYRMAQPSRVWSPDLNRVRREL